MRRMSLVATLVVALLLIVASVASAHHVDAVKSSADCTKVTAQFSGFKTGDGAVAYTVKVDGVQTNAGTVPAFNGDKTLPVTYPTALAGPAAHTVVFTATWPTQGSNNGTFTKTVTGCPVKLPCPDQPPTAPCNCPPGPAGPAGPPGTTTTITVVENHTTIIYRDLTCSSKRVFHVTAAQRLPDDDVFGKNRHQRIVGGTIQFRSRTGAAGYHEGQHVRKLVLKNGRLKADASFVGVIAPKGQVRVITLRLRLANMKPKDPDLILTRRVRLCLGKNGDMNRPPDVPQNGHADPSTTGSANIKAKTALEPA